MSCPPHGEQSPRLCPSYPTVSDLNDVSRQIKGENFEAALVKLNQIKERHGTRMDTILLRAFVFALLEIYESALTDINMFLHTTADVIPAVHLAVLMNLELGNTHLARALLERAPIPRRGRSGASPAALAAVLPPFSSVVRAEADIVATAALGAAREFSHARMSVPYALVFKEKILDFEDALAVHHRAIGARLTTRPSSLRAVAALTPPWSGRARSKARRACAHCHYPRATTLYYPPKPPRSRPEASETSGRRTPVSVPKSPSSTFYFSEPNDLSPVGMTRRASYASNYVDEGLMKHLTRTPIPRQTCALYSVVRKTHDGSPLAAADLAGPE
eukprot:gnl/Chilomastix_cuspidata/5135.p1 GENE.gnl/Chilomastix_cuspidata/5135~~gnl/Chilomastix_cuspidata/5135.p1  ORF type:complete len:332 (+),score=50.81 gnl/Chilomastix_cuspidata/5135:195-1190(+)